MFDADYNNEPCREVLGSLSAWKRGTYGSDKITQTACDLIRELFGLQPDAGVLFVPTGTAANILAFRTLLSRPWEAVVSTEVSHSNMHEAGALESFGHKLLTVDSDYGKFPTTGSSAIFKKNGDIHKVVPTVLSIANATELGAFYTAYELGKIAGFAKENQVFLHIDGARLANAAAGGRYQLIMLKGLFSDFCVDTLSFGLAKNGGAGGDVLIIKDPARANVASRYHKQMGFCQSRPHLIASQVIALLKDGLWLRNAQTANEVAFLLSKRLENDLGVRPLYPVSTNSVFVNVDFPLAQAIVDEEWGMIWPVLHKEGTPFRTVRFMASWASASEHIEKLIEFLKTKMQAL